MQPSLGFYAPDHDLTPAQRAQETRTSRHVCPGWLFMECGKRLTAALHGGEALWLYVLFEHQSTVDPLMAWRLYRYLGRIWERVLDERRGSELPFVLPLVLYKGERRWTVSEDFDALFPGEDRVRAALLPHVPRFRYVLQDLSALPDEALRGLALREVVLLALKHAKDGTVWDLPRWAALLVEVTELYGLRTLEAV